MKYNHIRGTSRADVEIFPVWWRRDKNQEENYSFFRNWKELAVKDTFRFLFFVENLAHGFLSLISWLDYLIPGCLPSTLITKGNELFCLLSFSLSYLWWFNYCKTLFDLILMDYLQKSCQETFFTPQPPKRRISTSLRDWFSLLTVTLWMWSAPDASTLPLSSLTLRYWTLHLNGLNVSYISIYQTVVLCTGCSMMLCQPTGGRCRLTEGCSFRRKVD